ncbi:calcium-translocating P-type ATPase, PMCA-type [Guggenheimella bovis]
MYRQQLEEQYTNLNTSADGLTSKDAKDRLKQFGPNEIIQTDRESILSVFFGNFKDVMILVLLAACVVSVLLKEYTDAILILAIVILNGVISTIQEYRAQNALDALKKLAQPESVVLRDGKQTKVLTSEIVPGDIVFLEAGNVIPADGRLISSMNFQVDESALTGESTPVEKDEHFSAFENVPIADRKNMVFSSTIVTYGRAKFLAMETGMHTEIGKIAFMIMNDDGEKTPLQKQLDHLGKVLATLVVLISLVIFGLGILEKREISEMFITAVGVAVAAIPEGLPAIVTIVMAVGVSKLAKRNAVIRTLPSVETLGSASVICSDKTGTLTQNKMKVLRAYLLDDKNEELVTGLSLCNDASISDAEAMGDPTEVALLDFAKEFQMNKADLEEKYPRIAELPFDSERKMMSTLHTTESGYIQFTKGGIDEILSRTTHIVENGVVRPITEQDKYIIQDKNEEYAKDALRVLALAKKDTKALSEEGLTFVGMVGMMDPAREEVVDSIKKAKGAGLDVVMITGDHLLTATTIAKNIGLLEEGQLAIRGSELDKMSEEEFSEKVEQIRVYARVAPEQKVRIVDAWKKKGKVVAMTGDGVNDAPALKRSDIGVAMGKVGTDVARGASDMVLLDDDFSTIVKAIESGRVIYDNIQRTVRYLISCNLAEVILMFFAILFNQPMPLVAVQLLWINLVTDSLPALALGVEAPEKNVMNRPPRGVNEKVLTKKGVTLTVIEGLFIGLLTYAVFLIGLETEVEVGRTMAFATIAFAQLVQAINQRSKNSVFVRGLFSNRSFIMAFLVSVGLQCAVLFLPPLMTIFKVVPLSSESWLIVLAASCMPFLFGEIRKLIVKE